jgi:hypothetical protein
MSRLIISTNDKVPRVSERTTFYFVDYEIPGPLVARMLAMQNLVDFYNVTLRGLSERRLAQDTAQTMVEELWHEIEETLRRFDGASVEPRLSEKATAAPTSAPLADNSKPKESRSSMKRKATQSSSRPAKSTSAKAAEKTSA